MIRLLAFVSLAVVACSSHPAPGRFCNEKGKCHAIDFDKRTLTTEAGPNVRVLEIRKVNSETWMLDSPKESEGKIEIVVANTDTLHIRSTESDEPPSTFHRR